MLADVETVEAGTLDTIVQHQRLSRVDVVKMDIEGGELAALFGARGTLQRFRPKLLLEISAAALAAQGATRYQVARLLAGMGYAIGTFDPQSGLPRQADSFPDGDSFNIVATWQRRPARESEDDAQRCKGCGQLVIDYPHVCAASPEKWSWVPGQGYRPK